MKLDYQISSPLFQKKINMKAVYLFIIKKKKFSFLKCFIFILFFLIYLNTAESLRISTCPKAGVWNPNH